jgi:hypothetical protein
MIIGLTVLSTALVFAIFSNSGRSSNLSKFNPWAKSVYDECLRDLTPICWARIFNSCRIPDDGGYRFMLLSNNPVMIW